MGFLKKCANSIQQKPFAFSYLQASFFWSHVNLTCGKMESARAQLVKTFAAKPDDALSSIPQGTLGRRRKINSHGLASEHPLSCQGMQGCICVLNNMIFLKKKVMFLKRNWGNGESYIKNIFKNVFLISQNATKLLHVIYCFQA